ncbi:MAG: HDOD domain-containing protein [Rhodoferax sp.]|uniref:HDOD domain-containing protein n=1 Tax=Rhodoferax sp. TaxID=50421 RepID=UPI0026247D76|nr:HDOD domain-containing protein [Rhodoferax sp.]MDD2880124.1 HDOD domain-containing protein [Rhodoferax sp.]
MYREHIAKDAAAATDTLIKSIGIPSRPGTLVQLQTEIASDDSDIGLIANLVASDVALTVATLRVVNSPVFALSRSCETVDKAIAMLGLQQLNVIVTGLVLRNVLRGDAQQLAQFWDVSGKRAYAMSQLARTLRLVDVPVAQSFGLFCDVGIPLLMQRFTDYKQTLADCHNERQRCFTAPEQDRHHTDHALIGAMMARSWGLSPTLCLAIQRHHDYSAFSDPKVPETVSRLMAMGLVTEAAIQRFAGCTGSAEWDKGGDHAAGALVLNVQDTEDWIDRLFHDFAAGLA